MQSFLKIFIVIQCFTCHCNVLQWGAGLRPSCLERAFVASFFVCCSSSWVCQSPFLFMKRAGFLTLSMCPCSPELVEAFSAHPTSKGMEALSGMQWNFGKPHPELWPAHSGQWHQTLRLLTHVSKAIQVIAKLYNASKSIAKQFTSWLCIPDL